MPVGNGARPHGHMTDTNSWQIPVRSDTTRHGHTRVTRVRARCPSYAHAVWRQTAWASGPNLCRPYAHAVLRHSPRASEGNSVNRTCQGSSARLVRRTSNTADHSRTGISGVNNRLESLAPADQVAPSAVIRRRSPSPCYPGLTRPSVAPVYIYMYDIVPPTPLNTR